MNADSAGIVDRPIVSAASNAATTWPPMTPPIVRITVFIPVATPVSVGRTTSTMILAMAAKVIGRPAPRTSRPRTMCHPSECHTAMNPSPIAPSSIPRLSGHFACTWRLITPASGPLAKPVTALGSR
jgi:hypothetical protein